MIEKVQKGQRITSSSQNKLIDEVNLLASEGSLRPRQMVQTPRLTPCLFQIRRFYGGYQMLSRPLSDEQAKYDYDEDYHSEASLSTAMWMYMGSSVEDLCRNVGAKEAYLLNPDHRDVCGKITDLWYKTKSADPEISGYYDGWIDLQYQYDSDVYGIYVQSKSLSTEQISNEVSGEVEVSSQVVPLSSSMVFCISPTKEISAISEELEYYLSDDLNTDTSTSSETSSSISTTYGIKDYVVIGKKNESSPATYSQMHIGALKGITGGSMEGDGCFEIDYEEDKWLNRYFYAGGILIGIDDKQNFVPPSQCKDCFVAVCYSTYNGVSLETFSTIGEYNAAVEQNNYTSYAPLYKMDEDGKVECDFRKMPIMDVWSLK